METFGVIKRISGGWLDAGKDVDIPTKISGREHDKRSWPRFNDKPVDWMMNVYEMLRDKPGGMTESEIMKVLAEIRISNSKRMKS